MTEAAGLIAATPAARQAVAMLRRRGPVMLVRPAPGRSGPRSRASPPR
ncbi:MAG: hypothetical protein ACLP7J_12755 [Streptosporangiaceae bacterium]